MAALALLSAVAIGFWVHRAHLDPDRSDSFVNGDLVRYHYPVATLLHRELRSLRVPLWNPHQLAGLPLLASVSPAALYPPNVLLMAWLPPARAIEVLTVLHLAMAGAFTWLLMGRLRVGPLPRVAAAVAFMLSGVLLRRTYHFQPMCGMVWLPLLLWAIHRLLAAPGISRALAAAGVAAMLLLAGYAQGVVLSGLAAAVYGAAGLLLVTPAGLRLRAVAAAALAGLLAAGLAAAQVLPTVELLDQAARAGGRLPVEQAAFGAPAPWMLLDGLIGGHLVGEADAGGSPAVLWRAATLTLPLVALGFAARGQRRHWWMFVGLAVFAGLFMLGTRAPVFRAAAALPLAGSLRFPVRMDYVYALSLAVLIGIGLQGVASLLRARAGAGRRAATAASAAIALAVGAELWARSPLEAPFPIHAPEARYAPAELIDFLAAHRGEARAFVETVSWYDPTRELQPTLGTVNGLFALPGYEPLIPSRYADYFSRGPVWRGFLHAVPADETPPPFVDVARAGDYAPGELARLFDLMSVRYYALPSHRSASLAELERFAGGAAMRVGTVFVVEREAALPRVYAVHRAEVETDPARALRRIRSGGFDPRGAAVVDRAVPPLGDAGGDTDGGSIRSDDPGHVTIDAHCQSACLLVLTDFHYPGWEVTVDGEPRELVRANTLFRAVHLAPGRHTVRHAYRPRSFRIGAGISIATSAAVVGVALLRWRSRRARLRGPGPASGSMGD